MKKISILGISSLFLLASLFTSCDSVKNTNNTQKGAGIGAGAGALIGAIIGNNTKLEQQVEHLLELQLVEEQEL